MNYIKDAFGYVMPSLLIIAIYVITSGIIKKIRKERTTLQTVLMQIAFGIYLVVIFAVTVSPIYGFNLNINWESVNIIPFMSLRDATINPLNLFGNIIMFIPMGIFPPMLSKSFYKIKNTLVLGFLMSLTIEFLQLFLGRGTDIDDIILNTIGTLIGYLIIALIVSKNAVIRKKINSSKIITVISYHIIMLAVVLVIGAIERYQCFNYDNYKTSQNQTKSNTVQTDKIKSDMTQSNQLDLSLEAQNVCVINAVNGQIIYEKNKDAKIAPASTAKMITALVVLDYCSMEDVVTVGDEIYELAEDASRAGLYCGDELSVQNLLYGLLLPSGNDADDQYSTAYDLVLIAAELEKNSALSEIVNTQQWQCIYEDGRSITYENTNLLINADSEYYDENVIGIKTGSSDRAGSCLVSGAIIDGELYISAVMGHTDEGRFADSEEIYYNLSAVYQK